LSRFVLDCSVTMSWCFEDEVNEYSESILSSLQFSQALVPSLWALEVANVLLVAERRKRINAAQVAHAISLLQSLPISFDSLTAQQAMSATLSLGRFHALSAYDAAYLELALREGLPLATVDQRLIHAAQACGVSIFSIS
jgi:predicted nucleic acid-binding protein